MKLGVQKKGLPAKKVQVTPADQEDSRSNAGEYLGTHLTDVLLS